MSQAALRPLGYPSENFPGVVGSGTSLQAPSRPFIIPLGPGGALSAPQLASIIWKEGILAVPQSIVRGAMR